MFVLALNHSCGLFQFFNLHAFIHDLKYPTVTYFVHLATLARDSSKKHLHTNQRNLIFMLLVRHVLQTFNLNGDCTLFSFGPGTSTVLEDWGSKKFLSDTESCCCRGPRHNLRGISNHCSKKKSVFVHDLCFTSLPHHFEERLGIFILININF